MAFRYFDPGKVSDEHQGIEMVRLSYANPDYDPNYSDWNASPTLYDRKQYLVELSAPGQRATLEIRESWQDYDEDFVMTGQLGRYQSRYGPDPVIRVAEVGRHVLQAPDIAAAADDVTYLGLPRTEVARGLALLASKGGALEVKVEVVLPPDQPTENTNG